MQDLVSHMILHFKKPLLYLKVGKLNAPVQSLYLDKMSWSHIRQNH